MSLSPEILKRHGFEPGEIEERFASELDTIPQWFERSIQRPVDLLILADRALDVACWGSALDTEHAETLRMLRLCGQAVLCAHRCLGNDQWPLRALLDDVLVEFNGQSDHSTVDAFRYLNGFFAAVIVGDEATIEGLRTIDIETIRQSPVPSPEYRYLLIGAVLHWWNCDSRFGRALIEAVKATDPDRPDIFAPDYTLEIDVPLIECLARSTEGAEKFQAALDKSSALYGKSWTRDDYVRRDPRGLLALELTAVSCVALDRGMTGIVYPPYVPAFLVEQSE